MNGQRDLYGITSVFVGKYFSVNVLQKNVVLMRFCIKGSKFNSNVILSTEKKKKGVSLNRDKLPYLKSILYMTRHVQLWY